MWILRMVLVKNRKSYNKESIQRPSDYQFNCPHSTVTQRFILDLLGDLPTMFRLLVRLRYCDGHSEIIRKKPARSYHLPLNSLIVFIRWRHGFVNSWKKSECSEVWVEPRNSDALLVTYARLSKQLSSISTCFFTFNNKSKSKWQKRRFKDS